MALIEMTAHSPALEMETDFFVVLPEAAESLIGMESKASGRCPTLYLLHGLSDDHSIWLRRTSIERYAAEYGLAVVMPFGDRSFYTDMHMGEKYWTFVAKELPQMCRSFFPMLSPRRKDTFVAGLSMGGYGALKCILRAPDVFSRGAALSAVADIVATRNQGMLSTPGYWYDLFGEKDALPGSFNDLFAAAEDYAKNPQDPIGIYMWCGTEDFLYSQNTALRDHMRKLGLPLTYEESPGSHSWECWDRKIQDILRWLPIGKGGER